MEIFIVGLLFALIVAFIVKNNKDKGSNLERYQQAKREYEELKKTGDKKESQESKPVKIESKRDPKNKKAKKESEPKSKQSKLKKTKKIPFFNQVSKNDWKTKQEEANEKGEIGEKKIVEDLKCLECYGKTLSNLYIPKENGKGTTEIDVVYINQYGIYVIESKNYNGAIYGDDKYDKWIVHYRKGVKEKKNKFYFYSPVKQNKTHIHHLSKKLWAIDKKDFNSLIVFIDPFKLKVNSEAEVITLKELNSFIKSKTDKASIVFSEAEVDKIYNILEPYTLVSDRVKKEHIKQAKLAKRYYKK